jgi:transcriptional regulator with XRE-family HTH domain
MTSSIRNLRTLLQITLDDLAFYLGITKSRAQQLEASFSTGTGEVDTKLYLLISQLEAVQKKGKPDSPFVNKTADEKATRWLTFIRDKAQTDIAILEGKLSEMKAEYATLVDAINLISLIIDDPGAAPKVKEFLIHRRPVLLQRSKKYAPMVQAKLIVRINEARGRANMWPGLEGEK